ncbi:MAG: hypothetical protein J6B77_08830 [Clostridia bacterium]|nr:hypothetical protein [Clostridia bacterium]
MARYKKIPRRSDTMEKQRAKKRERIRRVFEVIWAVLTFSGILILGLNQENDTVVGIGLIAIGLFSIPLAFFYIYAMYKGWKPQFWYDAANASEYIDTKTKEQDLLEYHVIRIISIVILLLFSIVLPILGVIKLL